MTGRAVPEWCGATPDTAIPQRVKLRIWEREGGKCHRCGRKLTPSDKWTIEHLIALVLGGQHCESNFGISCEWCKPIKDAEDVALKAKSAKIRARHLGITAPKRKLQSRGFAKAPAQHTATTPIRRDT